MAATLKFHTLDLAGLAWSCANSGYEQVPSGGDPHLRAAFKICKFDPQSLANTAWSLDVMPNHANLRIYMRFATDFFRLRIAAMLQSSGLCWVELHGILGLPEIPKETLEEGEVSVMIGFENHVAKPVSSLLRGVAGGSGVEHDVAIASLQDFAPEQGLPHVGVPFTRQVLSSLGVHVDVVGDGVPRVANAQTRAELWAVGTW